MVALLRGKVFWNEMNGDVRKQVSDCDPCQRYHSSNTQERVEVSHSLHADFCNYHGRDFIILVDKLTVFIYLEQTPNQGTSSAILAIKKWDKFSYINVGDWK